MTATDFEFQTAKEHAERYYTAHPGSPSAVRQPTISFRAGTWIALLGQSVGDGIVGLGTTVEQALRAFDVKYLNSLRPPDEARSFAG